MRKMTKCSCPWLRTYGSIQFEPSGDSQALSRDLSRDFNIKAVAMLVGGKNHFK